MSDPGADPQLNEVHHEQLLHPVTPDVVKELAHDVSYLSTKELNATELDFVLSHQDIDASRPDAAPLLGPSLSESSTDTAVELIPSVVNLKEDQATVIQVGKPGVEEEEEAATTPQSTDDFTMEVITAETVDPKNETALGHGELVDEQDGTADASAVSSEVPPLGPVEPVVEIMSSDAAEHRGVNEDITIEGSDSGNGTIKQATIHILIVASFLSQATDPKADEDNAGDSAGDFAIEVSQPIPEKEGDAGTRNSAADPVDETEAIEVQQVTIDEGVEQHAAGNRVKAEDHVIVPEEKDTEELKSTSAIAEPDAVHEKEPVIEPLAKEDDEPITSNDAVVAERAPDVQHEEVKGTDQVDEESAEVTPVPSVDDAPIVEQEDEIQPESAASSNEEKDGLEPVPVIETALEEQEKVEPVEEVVNGHTEKQEHAASSDDVVPEVEVLEAQVQEETPVAAEESVEVGHVVGEEEAVTHEAEAAESAPDAHVEESRNSDEDIDSEPLHEAAKEVKSDQLQEAVAEPVLEAGETKEDDAAIVPAVVAAPPVPEEPIVESTVIDEAKEDAEVVKEECVEPSSIAGSEEPDSSTMEETVVVAQEVSAEPEQDSAPPRDLLVQEEQTAAEVEVLGVEEIPAFEEAVVPVEVETTVEVEEVVDPSSEVVEETPAVGPEQVVVEEPIVTEEAGEEIVVPVESQDPVADEASAAEPPKDEADILVQTIAEPEFVPMSESKEKEVVSIEAEPAVEEASVAPEVEEVPASIDTKEPKPVVDITREEVPATVDPEPVQVPVVTEPVLVSEEAAASVEALPDEASASIEAEPDELATASEAKVDDDSAGIAYESDEVPIATAVVDSEQVEDEEVASIKAESEQMEATVSEILDATTISAETATESDIIDMSPKHAMTTENGKPADVSIPPPGDDDEIAAATAHSTETAEEEIVVAEAVEQEVVATPEAAEDLTTTEEAVAEPADVPEDTIEQIALDVEEEQVIQSEPQTEEIKTENDEAPEEAAAVDEVAPVDAIITETSEIVEPSDDLIDAVVEPPAIQEPIAIPAKDVAEADVLLTADKVASEPVDVHIEDVEPVEVHEVHDMSDVAPKAIEEMEAEVEPLSEIKADTFAAPEALSVHTTMTLSPHTPIVDSAIEIPEHTTSPSSKLRSIAEEVERPKSPWAHSFQVTTIGRGISPEEEEGIEEEMSTKDEAVIDEAVSDVDEFTEEVSREAEANIATPILTVEETEPSVEATVNTESAPDVSSLEGPSLEPPARPWTPSYSVHLQGSPMAATKELQEDELSTDEPATADETHEDVVADEAHVETATDDKEGADVQADADPIHFTDEQLAAFEVEEMEQDSSDVPQEPEVVETVVAHEAADTAEVPPVVETSESVEPVASVPVIAVAAIGEESELVTHDAGAATVEEREVSARPWTPSYSVHLQGSPMVASRSLHEEFVPVEREDVSTDDTEVHETREVEFGPMQEVDAEEPSRAHAQVEAPEVAHEELVVEASGDDTLESVQEIPVEEQAAIEEPETSQVTEQPDVSESAVEPMSSSWVASYSVSVQGSPLAEKPHLELPETAQQYDVDAGDTISESGDTPQHTIQATVDESVPSQDKLVLPVLSISTDGTEPVVEPAAAIADVPERPRSPWTPSYSVTQQGTGTPAEEEELDKLEPLPESAGKARAVEQESLQEESSGAGAVELHSGSEQTDNAEQAGSGAVQLRQSHSVAEDLARQDKFVLLSLRTIVAYLWALPRLFMVLRPDEPPSTPRTAQPESTTSSRMFPGGWFTPKPNQGRASMDVAQGEFSKTPSGDVFETITPELMLDESAGGASVSTMSTEDMRAKRRKLCIIM
ncbi:hypothetical protein AMATHDRAFT_45684 [Amanita thiersii Skay4041]|uniref:Uncharacterized protein n=1 Tax=Amanita thiersii Skay4041 TaxID=703135 RepID=A0A2A9NYI9_9AGAR|nr:hypothetical protein AMATHDRAFT_45684 [Amanita thiersii Skay4041]